MDGARMTTVREALRWCPVRGFEGLYEISDDGQVRGCLRTVGAANGKTKVIKPKPRQPYFTSFGHVYVDLYRDRKRTKVAVHRAVLETFVGPCPDGSEACHRDGNPANNAVGNLYWGTRSDNVRDALKHGTHTWASRSECFNGHPYIDGSYSIRSNGGRKCLLCNRRYQAKYKSKIRGTS